MFFSLLVQDVKLSGHPNLILKKKKTSGFQNFHPSGLQGADHTHKLHDSNHKSPPPETKNSFQAVVASVSGWIFETFKLCKLQFCC